MTALHYCEECDHMHPASRAQPSYRAMCSKFPRKSGSGFVSRMFWDRDSPFMFCKDINGGFCPLFEPKREPEKDTTNASS